MSDWTDAAKHKPAEDRVILVIAKAGINDSMLMEKHYRALAKWNDREKAFYPSMEPGVSSSGNWIPPKLVVVYWADLPEFPDSIAKENRV